MIYRVRTGIVHADTSMHLLFEDVCSVAFCITDQPKLNASQGSQLAAWRLVHACSYVRICMHAIMKQYCHVIFIYEAAVLMLATSMLCCRNCSQLAFILPSQSKWSCYTAEHNVIIEASGPTCAAHSVGRPDCGSAMLCKFSDYQCSINITFTCVCPACSIS